jgi:putative acetyltransferase
MTRVMNSIEIIPFSNEHQAVFRSLNEEWLDKYHLMEDHDVAILNDPRKMILENGGEIFLARVNERIVGTAALMKEHERVYELVKMAVAPEFRNQGIGNILIDRCIAKAKDLNAEKIILFSNHQLKNALKLYEKFGFNYIPVENSPFLTADIKMELIVSRQ